MEPFVIVPERHYNDSVGRVKDCYSVPQNPVEQKRLTPPVATVTFRWLFRRGASAKVYTYNRRGHP